MVGFSVTLTAVSRAGQQLHSALGVGPSGGLLTTGRGDGFGKEGPGAAAPFSARPIQGAREFAITRAHRRAWLGVLPHSEGGPQRPESTPGAQLMASGPGPEPPACPL